MKKIVNGSCVTMVLEGLLLILSVISAILFSAPALFELLEGNGYIIVVYLLAVAFFILHLVIRKNNPEKFQRVYRIWRPLSKRIDDIVSDLFFKFCI